MKGAGSQDSCGDHRYRPKVSPQSAFWSDQAFVELQNSDFPFCLRKKKKKQNASLLVSHTL